MGNRLARLKLRNLLCYTARFDYGYSCPSADESLPQPEEDPTCQSPRTSGSVRGSTWGRGMMEQVIGLAHDLGQEMDAEGHRGEQESRKGEATGKRAV